MTHIGEALCGRNVTRGDIHIQGFGSLGPDGLFPANLVTAPHLEILLMQGKVEIVIGVPHAPSSAEKVSVPRFEPQGDRDKVHRWAKAEVERRATELLREKPSSYFAERSPLELACEEVYAKKKASIDKEVKRRQDAIERLRAELPKKAERLRQEAAERERQAKLAEEEAARIDAVSANAEAAAELHALRTRLEVYVRALNALDREDARFCKMQDIVRIAIPALNSGQADAARTAIDELAAVYEPEQVSDLAAGERRALAIGPISVGFQ